MNFKRTNTENELKDILFPKLLIISWEIHYNTEKSHYKSTREKAFDSIYFQKLISFLKERKIKYNEVYKKDKIYIYIIEKTYENYYDWYECENYEIHI